MHATAQRAGGGPPDPRMEYWRPTGARTSIYLSTSPEVEHVSGRYFVNGKATESSPASYDEESARRLWEASEQLMAPG